VLKKKHSPGLTGLALEWRILPFSDQLKFLACDVALESKLSSNVHEEHLTNSCIYQNYLEIRKGKVMKKYIFMFKLVKASSAIHGYVSHRTGWKTWIYVPEL
jgi:hypothetical protein